VWKGIVVDDDDRPLAGVRVGVFLPGQNDTPSGIRDHVGRRT
jgi:hypothetical protein